MNEDQIFIWNRRESREEVEQVYGDAWIRWLYGTSMGQILTDQVLSKVYLSRLYGSYQSTRWSGRKVLPFIKKFKIPMQEFQKGPFQSFNDFFIRKFKAGARPFAQDAPDFPAFSEARYFAYEKIDAISRLPVKGSRLSASALMGGAERAQPFVGGPVLVARLCPTDYHRFHFPDDGEILESYSLPGHLHSVNPLALQYKEDIFATNERHVSLLQTRNFGKLAYIEVGALCVGKIVQTHSKNKEFRRGAQKGYFLFGGSTVIVLGEPGKWAPDLDLLNQTSQGRETLVRLGERIARRLL